MGYASLGPSCEPAGQEVGALFELAFREAWAYRRAGLG